MLHSKACFHTNMKLLNTIFFATVCFLFICSGKASAKYTPANEGISAAYKFMQDTLVKGNVFDEYGRPLSGVSVSVKKSNITATTDPDGLFEINAPSAATLVFVHPDYRIEETRIAGSKSVTATLVKKYLHYVDSVDVLYETRNKEKILGAVSTIYTNQLTTTPSPLYAYSFAGRLPGLYTQQTRGWVNTSTTSTFESGFLGSFPTEGLQGSLGPNDNTEIFMRLRGQSPITIIDGVQRDIYSLNPENIESVSVLKDALSTIMLGMRGSRGVILVTTKKPLPGKPHVSFTAQARAAISTKSSRCGSSISICLSIQ